MACVPLTSNKHKLHFDGIVNIDSLMAVPYVNGVFFTKLRLLNSRNSRQYSQRVSVVDNSVHFNSSHTFQCKVRINPETNVLESCRLKISVRMESDGGKSFHKIGYVIVDLACFVLGGFVRCRRRYLLKGYDGDKRRVGKRQDNSLLVVSFTCQQHFGNTCFRLPAEDLSNCVSTSHSMDALDPVPAKDGNTDVLQTAAVATTASSTVLPSLLTEDWNEERVQMRSRRRRKEKEHEEERKEEEEEVKAEVVQALEGRRETDVEEFGGAYDKWLHQVITQTGLLTSTRLHNSCKMSLVEETSRFSVCIDPINDPDAALTNFLASSSSIDDQVSSGGEYISPTSVSIDQEEGDEAEIFSSPLPQQPPSLFPFVLSPSELIQRIREKGGGREGFAASSSSSSSSPPSSHGTSTSTSPSTTPSNIHTTDVAVSTSSATCSHIPDFSSLPIHSRASGSTGRSSSGGGGDGGSSGGSDAVVGGQFHTCPHVRPSSLLSQHQRKMLGADSGFHFHVISSTSASASASSSTGVADCAAIVVGTVAEESVNERCSLSSGFQSHSRNSSFESAGLSRCFPGELTTTPTGNSGDCQLSIGDTGGSKQHLIDATRAPHDDVVSQVLRTSAIIHRPASPPPTSATIITNTSTCPFGAADSPDCNIVIRHWVGDATPPSLPLPALDHGDVGLGDGKMETKRISSLFTHSPWRDTSSCICSISEYPFFHPAVTTAVADKKITTPFCGFVSPHPSAYTSAPCLYSFLDAWEQSRRRSCTHYLPSVCFSPLPLLLSFILPRECTCM
eukprot:TsM_000316100 transcript=TsM_000316100 gene=TsM_000316100